MTTRRVPAGLARRHLFELKLGFFKRFVEIPCLLGDACPAEALDLVCDQPCEALAFLGVFHKLIHLLSEVHGVATWVEWGEWILLAGDGEKACLIVNNDLRDTADHGANDGGLTGHGFKVNDTEWLVDGWATEDGCTR